MCAMFVCCVFLLFLMRILWEMFPPHTHTNLSSCKRHTCVGYRYMRNDLMQLQIRCVFHVHGCDVISALESMHTHEAECDYSLLTCRNTGTQSHTHMYSGQTFTPLPDRLMGLYFSALFMRKPLS